MSIDASACQIPATRRAFLLSGEGAAFAAAQKAAVAWYLRAYRWGQTNITEKDPVRYDIKWWREYWKRTAVQASLEIASIMDHEVVVLE